jgi:Kdo2-lipid IVA lauroyltransferase/acyltransferase
MSRRTKSALRINLEYYPVLTVVKLAQMIPLRLALILGQTIFLLYSLLAIKRRTMAIKHILHSGIVKTHSEAVKLARKNFMELGKTAVEIIKIDDVIIPENVESRVSVLGDEKCIEKFLHNSTPAILVTGHLGNWELLGITYCMLSKVPLLSVIRPMSNPKLQKFFYRRKDNHNHDSCVKKGAIKPLLKALRSGKSIAVAPDQHAKTKEGVETTFFGQPARTHFSPALLHIKTGIPIIVVALRRTQEYLKYEFVIEELTKVEPSGNKEADIQKTVQLYTDALERIIRQSPEQWVWSHRRWLNLNR